MMTGDDRVIDLAELNKKLKPVQRHIQTRKPVPSNGTYLD